MHASSTHQESPADEIRQEMADVRRQLPAEVGEVVDGARRLVDWRNYVRDFPWASVGVAAALGYAVVPRKLHIIRPDADTLQELAKSNRLVVGHRPQDMEKSRLLASAVPLVGRILMRAALAYLRERAGKHGGKQTRTGQKSRDGQQTVMTDNKQ